MFTKLVKIDDKFYIEKGLFFKTYLSNDECISDPNYWWYNRDTAGKYAEYKSEEEALARWKTYKNKSNKKTVRWLR